MNRILLILFTILSTQVFAQRSQQELSHLKAKSPYCVDKLEEFKGRLYWSISNSWYMLKEHLAVTPKTITRTVKRKIASTPKKVIKPKRKMASVPKSVTKAEKKDTLSINKPHQFTAGISANHYSTDASAESLAARVGYKHDFSNSFEVQATLEVEKFISISSSDFQAEINKPIFNGSLIGFKKLDKLKVGAEVGLRHYLQFIDNPSDVRFDITPFLAIGGALEYSLSDSFNLGAGAAYLKASDEMDSKGYELKAFGSYSFGTTQKYSIIPNASITKLENSFTDISNNKLSVLFQVKF